jgi:prolyl-tRNA synthetase
MGFGRTVAATIAHHGDDNGLVLPPKVAPKQVVVIPILIKGKEDLAERYAEALYGKLKEAGIRVEIDADSRSNPGDKYYKWEMYGVPVRVEVGPREAQNKKATLVRRDTFEKTQVDESELIEKVNEMFNDIFENLKAKDKAKLDSLVVDAYDMDQLQTYMESRLIVRVN